MASSRKVRNANKRYAKINEDWQDKDDTNVHKNKKKKLSDMLGSQWSKDELERFYGAYRKYGKDWRKVAGAIRDRTSEMVEALYNMNKAYLSLPEGTATAAGLTAMMTDHYNILDGSNSDRESNDSPKASKKPQKRGRARFQSVLKTPDTRYPDVSQSQPALSTFGCLSLLKKRRSGDLLVGNRPRAVGKRTPRIPVASMYYRDDKGVADRRAKTDANHGDDEGAHVAALALAEVCQRGGSPQVSETPGRSGDRMFLSPVKSSDRKNADSEMGSSKLHGFHLDADYPEGSLGSREAETGDYTRGASFSMKNEGSGSGKPQKKVKRSQKRRKKAARKTGDQFEDGIEACSGTEEGHSARKSKEDSELEALGWPSSSSNKRSRQLFFGDESSALDALHTLADLSVNILQPSSIVESESSAQIKDENKDDDSDEKPGMPASVSVYDKKGNSKSTARKVKRQSEISNTEVVTRKKAKLSKDPHHDGSASSDVKQQACTCGVKTEKKKRKSSTPKVSKDVKSVLKDVEKTEVSAEEGKVSSNKETTTQCETTPQADFSSKGKSRRKSGIQQMLTEECKPTKGADDTGSDKLSYSVNNVIDLKDKLSHCLSSRLLRRWCLFEWFYSALDYPWFAKSEFVEYLNHVKLGHVPRLTRVEWGVIRSSLGKPRRLSKQFLHEEREKLSQYRDSVRQHYAELRSGVREGLPTDLARPLAVGQRVIACHPRTRELHDGSVLTVEKNCCRIQFDRPELGVEFVMDIDCMPLHPIENFPESLRQKNIAIKYLSEVKLEDQMKELGSGGTTRFTSNVNVNGADAAFHIPSGRPINTLMKQAKGDTIDSIVQAKATINEVAAAAQQAMYNQPCSLSQIQEKEADIRALAELARALDKKEALLVELRHMNEEVSGMQKDGATIRDLKHFRTQYAMVLVQLRDSNDQVASALLSLRQRNTYHGNQVQSYPTSMENGGAFTGAPDPYNRFGYINPESGSQVIEVIETSRRRAKMMVDVAVQAMCKVSEGENAFAKIGEALDSLNSRGTGSGSSILGIRRIPPDSGQANTSYQDNGTPAPAASNTSGLGCDSETQFPTELISSCISTILMIQNCTEKQYHPAEVAHILDSALSRLQPCSSQNIPIFREIEMCIGIIKNQMLALIPTPSS